MKMSAVASDSKTHAGSLPALFPGGKTGVLLLHGFTGDPRDLRDLAFRLNNAGFTASLPRLPGHGTNGSDFLQSGWRDWLRAAVDAWIDLAGRCERVHLVGYSMGGVLAALLAAHFPVSRLVLAAPALKTRNPLLPLSPLLGLFYRRMAWRLDWSLVPDDPELQEIAREYWQWRYPRQAASLLRLQRKANSALRRITADTLTIVGTADQSVPVSVIGHVEGRIAARVHHHVILEGAKHGLFLGASADRAMDETVRWLTLPDAPATVRS